MAANILYSGYGFSENNKGVLDYKVDGIEPKDLNGIYTMMEAEMDWRKVLKQHITNEHNQTRSHVTAEVDDAEQKILTDAQAKHTYTVSLINEKATSIKNDISDLSKKVDDKTASLSSQISGQSSTLNSILSTVNSINGKVS